MIFQRAFDFVRIHKHRSVVKFRFLFFLLFFYSSPSPKNDMYLRHLSNVSSVQSFWAIRPCYIHILDDDSAKAAKTMRRLVGGHGSGGGGLRQRLP